jgi:hypothetical protein
MRPLYVRWLHAASVIGLGPPHLPALPGWRLIAFGRLVPGMLPGRDPGHGGLVA